MEHEIVTDPVHVFDGHAAIALHDPTPEEQFLHRITSQAPWWLVSMVFHILLIVLAFMFSIAINLDPDEKDPLITVSRMINTVEPEKENQPKIVDAASALGENNFHATDPNAKTLATFEVPPSVLPRMELGDHIETINLELPDTHGPSGNPDAKIFHLVHGCQDEAGGGGKNGTGLDDIIGAGGDRSSGSGGGRFGGHGLGDGPGDGPGGGSLGGRTEGGRKWMVTHNRGTQKTEDAVEAALRWLSYHQETDGHWDAKKYVSGEKTDTAVTSMALLCFLGAGHSERVGIYKDNVKRAVGWLRSKQAANGLIWDTTDAGGHRGEGYPGAIATLALAEAAAMANVPETHDAAQRAVDYCTRLHQAGEGSDKLGWRYHAKMEGDLSVTGWFIMALKSAKVAHLRVDPASFDGAIKFLDSVEHKAPGGATSYAPASTYWYMVKEAHEPHRLTAIGCLCRQFLGWKKEDLEASVDGFVASGGVPSWGGNGGNVDLYYWYYGSLCTFQQGGETWKKWNEGLMSALVPNQRKEGDDAGSWDPVGNYSTEWGRVGETAMGCLCLEVYYRYKKLSPDR